MERLVFGGGGFDCGGLATAFQLPDFYWKIGFVCGVWDRIGFEAKTTE